MSHSHTRESRKYGSQMDIDSDSMSQSTTTEYTQRSRPIRRKVSMATRRRSQLLYLEKYGLDQPNWHSSHDDYDDNDMIHDTTSRSHNEHAHPITYIHEPMDIDYDKKQQRRPISIRNAAQVTSMQKRPARFIKPQKSYFDSSPASEFDAVHQLIEAYTDKVYIEGYLQKRNDLNTNGSSCGSKKWSLWYVELCGPVLTLWDAEKQKGDVYPQYINITDSTVSHENRLTAETRTHLFSLNSAGANRYLLQATDEKALYRWIRAIRLSCFECARIQEIYTKAFITRPQFQPFWTSSSSSTTEGTVQVRFPGTTGWKTYWAVASNRKIEKRLFNKKIVPTNGQIMFFESRKAKYPMMTLEHVVQAYTVYPESSKLIHMATLFKIEGSLFKRRPNNHEMQLVSSSSSALIMTSDTNDLARWLIGVFDAFRLYGRPEKLWDDANNAGALNFAEMCHTRLFLEIDEVESVDASYGTTLLGNKKEYTVILLEKVIRGIPPMEPKQDKTEMTSIEAASERPSLDQSHEVSESVEQAAPTKNVHNLTNLRKVTCASDDSDSEEEDQEQKEEIDSDDESIYHLSLRPPVSTTIKEPSKAMKPMTPNTSKSGSEVSEVAPTKLTLTPDMVMDDSFVNSILNETESLFSEPSKPRRSSRATETGRRKGSVTSAGQGASDSDAPFFNNSKNKRSFYSQQRANSMMPLTSYGSTGSVHMGEPVNARLQHHHTSPNVHSSHWETSSMDARMTHGNDSFYSMPHYATQSAHFGQTQFDNTPDDEDDNMPLFVQNSLLNQVHSQSSQAPLAKKLESHARTSGQSLVQVASPSSSSNASRKPVPTPRTGLLGIISEKEEREKRAHNYGMPKMSEHHMRERMIMDQQQMMMQQYMQTPFTNPAMMQQAQMMMPLMDPRAMPPPMMDPRWMPPPMMMYNPQFMMPPMMSSQPSLQNMPMMSSSRSATQDNSSRSRHKYNPMSSSASINQSVTSDSRMSATSRRVGRKHS